jgi:heme/copper-type cytochrome/quinol oxidase subunit 2
MNHDIRKMVLLLLAALCSLAAICPAPVASEQPENPCLGAQEIIEKACKKAREPLFRDRPRTNAATSIRVTLSAEGSRYGIDDLTAQTSPDPGAPTLPRAGQVDIVSTSDDVLYDWSVTAFGIGTALIPGRIQSIRVGTEHTGKFPT